MDIPTSPPIAALDLLSIGSFDPIAGGFHDIDYTGKQIDMYAVGERIGRGGMADVYRAHDTALRCDVALKILRPRLASPDMCARMVQEAQAAAAIHHPHMVRVFGVGTLTGSAYLAMELLRGITFRQFVAEHGGRLPWRDAIAMLTPAMEALHEAHELGLVHRDVKADNLFVTTRGRDLRFVMVLDLGIAKAGASFRGPYGPATTPQGRIVGTPTHMAPEQIEEQPVDRRCDVYAMGVTLYHALTGRLPFPAIPEAPLKTMQRHLSEVPPMFADVAPDAELPAALEGLVRAALAKRPVDRPPSMRALAEALEALAAPPPPIQRAAHRGPTLALAVALVVLGALLMWLLLGRPALFIDAAPARAILVPDVLAPVHTPAPVLPDMSPRTARPATEDPPPTTQAPRDAARRRTLAASRALAACRVNHGSDEPLDLPVVLTIETDGSVAHARILTAFATAATACFEVALLAMHLAPGPRREIFRHTLPAGRP